MRRIFLSMGAVGLAGFCWLAVVSHQARVDPGAAIESGRAAGAAGPPWSVLNAAAEERLEQGIAALNAPGPSPASRLSRYRDHLRAAEELLAASLRSRPTQADALVRLAAVRWELLAPKDEVAAARSAKMLEQAGELAPGSPLMHRRIGVVYLRMGKRERGLHSMRRALELGPASAPGVVADMREALLTLAEIAEALPRSPEVLVALGPFFVAEGQANEYADLVEPYLDEEVPPRLLSAYGEACLRAGAAARLERALTALEARDDAVEAERLRLLSKAHAVLGDPDLSFGLARRAAELLPDEPLHAENLGDRALASGQAETALRAFRSALRLRARASGGAAPRARLYAKIGRTEEQLGRPDAAYDAYRLALQHDPDEPTARERLDRMRRDAGIPGRAE